jgi:uncharacterized protein (DUF2126 family)
VNEEFSVFAAHLRAHDEAIAARGIAVWIGAEPTFTNRHSEAPEWLSAALGPSKEDYARRLIARQREALPGSLVLQSVGRQYPGEPLPRWSLGLYARRDGVAVWDGPPDPLGAPCPCVPATLQRFREALATALEAHGWRTALLEIADAPDLRLIFRMDGEAPHGDPRLEPMLARPPLHGRTIPISGIVDELAARGDFLISLGCMPLRPGGQDRACLELPQFPNVPAFLAFLDCAARAAREAKLGALTWRGFPPPVDHTIIWSTLTPDPAVLEVNQAPAPDVRTFYAWSRALYADTEAIGLAPYRAHYNGEVTESGGGGQFTLGGPDPLHSPFFVAPQLAPRLVRYFTRHPALSYLFAPAYIGSASQSPRADEGIRETFSELAVALEQVAREPAPEPERIWRSLSPFMVDPSGNTHRAELNIEKLWNPYLPGRGRLGLIEFRAFRMARAPERAAAIAALLRAIAAMLSERDVVPELTEWGPRLHDRFALPHFLRQDLAEVFADLDAAGLGLGEPICAWLRKDPMREIGRAELDGCRLTVENAVEFWPLIGDAASQETGSSRLVDASTARLQVSLHADSGDPGVLEGWQLLVGRYRIPLREEQGVVGTIKVFGLRYRRFLPSLGLHPGIPAQGPITLLLINPAASRSLRITLHEWRLDGQAYPGLPADLDEARERRAARFSVKEIAVPATLETIEPPPCAVSDYCLDLRRT